MNGRSAALPTSKDVSLKKVALGAAFLCLSLQSYQDLV